MTIAKRDPILLDCDLRILALRSSVDIRGIPLQRLIGLFEHGLRRCSTLSGNTQYVRGRNIGNVELTDISRNVQRSGIGSVSSKA